MTKTSYIQWDDIHFVLYQHSLLDLYSASSMKQSAGRHIDIIGTHYHDSLPSLGVRRRRPSYVVNFFKNLLLWKY
jgi:hypothetical protein